MGSFILAGIVFAAAVVVCIFIVFADGVSDAPSQDGISPVPVFVGGSLVSTILFASHWMSNVGW